MEASASEAPPAPDGLLGASISRRRCVRAIYNNAEVVLAPYVLFARHGDLHIAALTVARDGQPPKQPKVGTFKISGLRDLQATNRLFSPRMDLLTGFSESDVLAQVG